MKKAALIFFVCLFAVGAAYGIGQIVNYLRQPPAVAYEYVAALRSHKGAPYAEPGSEGSGMSCSELIRRAYLEIDVPEASKQIIREKKCLSDGLRAGCFDQLRQIATAANLSELDRRDLRPGDVAVLGDEAALHTVAYLGNGIWIESDPVHQKVREFTPYKNAPIKIDINNPWLVYRATLLRWKTLENW